MKNNLKVSPKRDFMYRALFSKNDNVDLLEDLISSIICRKVKIKSVLREGRKENNIMVAKNMLKNGIKIEVIMDCTKLSKKEIEDLK